MATQEASLYKNGVQLELPVHRRVLDFLNEAIRPQDLMYEKLPPPNPEMDHTHEHDEPAGNPARRLAPVGRRKILDPDIAEEIIEFRDREFPLGFRNVRQLLGLRGFDLEHLDTLRIHFSNS